MGENLVSLFKGTAMFDNSALRRIFEAKRDEVTGETSKLHNEEIRNLGWAGHVERM
jgi:hypothetical protein